MSFASIANAVVSTANKVWDFIDRNSSTICLVGGSVMVIGGGIFACKATLEADEVFEEHRENLSKIDRATNATDEDLIALGKDPVTERYTPDKRRRDLVEAYRSLACNIVRLYWGPALLISGGFMAIFGGYGIISKRYGVALESIAAIDSKFASYRNNVIEAYGERVDKLMAGELILEKGYETELETVDENGNPKVGKVKYITQDAFGEEDFTFIFDSRSKYWDESGYLFNDNTLERLQNRVTFDLQTGRINHIFMNDICKMLDLKKAGATSPGNAIGHNYGYTSKPAIGSVGLDWDIVPAIYAYNTLEDKQIPMLLPLPDTFGSASEDAARAEELEFNRNEFVATYIENPNNCAYIIQFNVETDERGIPREIASKVYGKK